MGAAGSVQVAYATEAEAREAGITEEQITSYKKSKEDAAAQVRCAVEAACLGAGLCVCIRTRMNECETTGDVS